MLQLPTDSALHLTNPVYRRSNRPSRIDARPVVWFGVTAILSLDLVDCYNVAGLDQEFFDLFGRQSWIYGSY